MTPALVLTQVLTGLAGASSLFLVAAGLTVIFGVTRVVNFSHGSLAMLGAYVGWSVLTRLPGDPVSFAVGVAATVAGVAAVGAVIEVLLLRRIYRAPELFQLLATFGVVLIVADVTVHVWGAQDLALPRAAWLRGAVDLGGARFPVFDLVLIGAGPVVLAALQGVLRRTRWGVLVRAATLDREMVGALGVDQRWLFTSVFALGAGLAGLAGVLALPDGSAHPGMDLSVIVEAFVVVVVGGLGSVVGAYLAALLIGELEAFGVAVLPEATLVLVFVVMAVVLAVRPRGLLGRVQAEARGVGALATVRAAPAGLRMAGAVGLALAAGAPFVLGGYGLSVLTEMAILTLFAASLHFMMGPGGMPSFGHAAFFGIGAYTAGLLVQGGGVAMAPAVVAAPVVAGVAALVVGVVVVRLSGVYLAMLTLAFAQIVWAVAFQWVAVTGGDNGVLGLWPTGWLRDPAAFYWVCLAVCVGAVLGLRRMLYAPFGYGLRATRDHAGRAAAIGLRVGVLRLAAFTLAGSGAGLSGGLYAFAKGSVFPAYAGIERSIDALLMVLLGGVQTMSGPIVGGLAYVWVYDTALQVAGDWWRLSLGGTIIALVLLFPEGIAGATQKVWRHAD